MKKLIIKWLMKNIDLRKEIFKIYNGKAELVSINLSSWKLKKDKWSNISISFWCKLKSSKKRFVKKAFLNGEMRDIIILNK